MTASSVRQAHEKWTSKMDKQQKHLLPGIPDDITLHEISPKLAWKVLCVLSSVSRAWRQAIQSRKVYDVRIRSHSMTETFAIVNLNPLSGGIALWSVQENSLMRLPPIRHRSYHLVSFDGRIYLMGRAYVPPDLIFPYEPDITDEVFVLDVAAQTGWKKCTSMSEHERSLDVRSCMGRFLCLEVKRPWRTVTYPEFQRCGSEVYNPEKDVWSAIKPMPESFFRAHAGEEEIFVHSQHGSHKLADFMDVYHPGKDEWRVATPFARRRKVHLFEARGKLHSIDDTGIDFYNAKENSWTRLHTFSFIERVRILSVLSVDGELLLMHNHVISSQRNPERFSTHLRLAKSNGFGSEKNEIVWQQVLFTDFLQNTGQLTTILL